MNGTKGGAAGGQGPTPAQSEEFARVSSRLSVGDYLPRTFHDGSAAPGKCEWSSHVAHGLTPKEVGALAWLLIDSIMFSRFGPAKKQYDQWRRHTLSGTPIPSPGNVVIGSFVKPVFGLPGAPKNDDHLHGHVGEWLWYLLTRDSPTLRVQPEPKSSVTDGGADGFSIYETPKGEFRFRLWESKKNTGAGPLKASLNTAYKQLEGAGQEYVAKIVGAYAHYMTSDEIVDFVTELPEAWVQGSEIVGAGVTLATHQILPKDPFANMASHLPLLSGPGQLRGLVASVSTLDKLARTVREYAWTAL